MNNDKFTIDKITLSPNSLDILWNDKQISHFHFLWLRDNCPTSFHKDTRMRKFNILNVSEKIYPLSYFIDKKNNLIIKWNEDNHVSIFSNSWLRNNCYTIKNRKHYLPPYTLWDS